MNKILYRTGIILLVLVIAGLLGWYIYNTYITNTDNPNTDNPIDKVKALDKINTDFIDEFHILEGMIQVDKDNYFLISRAKVTDEQGVPAGFLSYDYTIYKYNMNNGVHLKNIQFDKHFEYIGLNKEDKTLWVTIVDIENNTLSRSDTEFWEIDYENMVVKNKYSNKKGVYNLIISSNGLKWAYTTQTGLYTSDFNFENEKLLIKNIPDKKDAMNSKAFIPYEFVGDKLVYSKVGYEWTEGIGIMDFEGENNKFIEIMDCAYLKYDNTKNTLYYTDNYVPENTTKLDVSTLQKENIYTLTNEQKRESNVNIKISDNFKYLLITESKYTENTNNVNIKVSVYDIDNKEVISTYDLPSEEFASVQYAYFADDKIIFVNFYRLYVWNFLADKGV